MRLLTLVSAELGGEKSALNSTCEHVSQILVRSKSICISSQGPEHANQGLCPQCKPFGGYDISLLDLWCLQKQGYVMGLTKRHV